MEVSRSTILGHHRVDHVSVSLAFGKDADRSYDQPESSSRRLVGARAKASAVPL